MKQILDYADIIIEAPCYLGYIWAADKFCKKYLGTSKKNELLFVFFSFSGCLLMNIANRQYTVPYIFFMMLNHIFFMGLVLLLFRADREKKILAASMLMIIVTLVGNFCVSFLSCLALFLWHTVKKIPEPFLGAWEAGLIEYASFVMVILAVYWMAKHLMSVFYGKTRKWYVILAIPLLVITTVVDMASWGASNGIMVRSGGNMGLYYDQIFSHMEFCVLSMISMIALGFYVFGMDKIYLEQKKSGQYYSQIAAYKMLEEQYSQSERLRHDMKNHIIALSGLLENKEWEKMGDYLRTMEENGSLGSCEEITGNRVVDALLYQKRKIAEQKNIIWECDVQMPKVCCINEFDLCVLFGNLLDNAVKACEGLQGDGQNSRQFINVQAKAVKKCFLLEVKNSADVAEKDKAGLTNAKGYGIGLLNISDMVHRYNGVMSIEVQNSVFIISILMPLCDAVHNIKQVS